MFQKPLLPHIIQNAETIQLRHHNIQQNQNKILVRVDQSGRILSVVRLQYLIVILKNFAEDCPVYLFVINNQKLLFFHP